MTAVAPEIRFARLVDRSGGPDACWLWKGATSKKGSDHYGSFRTAAGMVPAHRFALASTGVDLSNVSDVMHTCDVPLCCNHAHLKPGTRRDNMQDALRKGRLHLVRGAHGRFAPKRLP